MTQGPSANPKSDIAQISKTVKRPVYGSVDPSTTTLYGNFVDVVGSFTTRY